MSDHAARRLQKHLQIGLVIGWNLTGEIAFPNSVRLTAARQKKSEMWLALRAYPTVTFFDVEGIWIA